MSLMDKRQSLAHRYASQGRPLVEINRMLFACGAPLREALDYSFRHTARRNAIWPNASESPTGMTYQQLAGKVAGMAGVVNRTMARSL